MRCYRCVRLSLIHIHNSKPITSQNIVNISHKYCESNKHILYDEINKICFHKRSRCIIYNI